MNATVRPCVRPSRYRLLNHWAEYTKLATCKGVREQYYLFTCPSFRTSRYRLLNRRTEFNRIYYRTSPHDKSLREEHYFSVRQPTVHLSVAHSYPRPLGGV